MKSELITAHAVRSAAIAALADAEGLATEAITEALDAVGDDFLFELDSKKSEVMIAAMEEVFDRELPAPADLKREQFASVGALVDLVAAKVVGSKWATT
jgi:acyl carrier protein